MKNTLKILGKSLIGVPVSIFFYELLNLTISIILNQYVKLDGFNLNYLIADYIDFGVIGYSVAFIFNYATYSSQENQIKRTENMIMIIGIILTVITLIMSINNGELFLGLIVIAMIGLLMCVLSFIVFIFNKKEIEDINKKIKENQNKED